MTSPENMPHSDSPAGSTVAGQWLRAANAAWFTFCLAWRGSPVRVITLVVANAVLAQTPALEVTLIGWLTSRAEDGSNAWWLPLLLLAFVMGGAQIIGQATGAVAEHVAVLLRRVMLNDLLGAVGRLSPRQLATPTITARIASARDQLQMAAYLPSTALSSIAAIMSAAALCVSVWVISPVAGVLVLAAMVPTLVMFGWQGRQRDAAVELYGTHSRRATYTVEQLVSQRTGTELLALGSGQVVSKIADGYRYAANRVHERMYIRFAYGGLLSSVTTSIVLGAALLGILVASRSGALVAAGIIGVLAGLEAILYAGSSLGQVLTQAQTVGVYRSVTTAAAHARPRAIENPASLTQISLEDVSFTYPGVSRAALQHVSLTARRGEMIALVGANGAGKTTAINLLLGILDPSEGTVKTQADYITHLTPPHPHLVGHLTQEFGRYEFTVRDALRLGRADGVASDEEMWEALRAARAREFVDALPGGLDCQLGEQFGGPNLSGGQWQRLALARIYLRGAPVWILDEPTSAIDAEAEQDIFHQLGAEREKRITIVVSHRAWTLKDMDRIYVFDDGQVIEEGTFSELLAHGGRFSTLFRQQLA